MLLTPSIRPAVADDAQSIFGFIQGFAKRFGVIGNKNVVSYVKKEGAVERLTSQLSLAHPPFRCLMAENKSNPIGCLLYYPGFSDWAHSSYPWFDDLYAKDVDAIGDNRITRRELVKVLAQNALEKYAPRIETRSLVKHAETRLFYTDELGMYITSEWKAYRAELPLTPHEPASQDITVRFASRADLRNVAMYIQNSADAQGSLDKVNRRGVLQKLENEFRRKTFECLIAEEQGNALGFAIFYQAYSSWEQCSYMMIEDLHRFFARKGVGKALYLKLCEIGEERGYARIETRIRTTSRTVESAVKFVEAMGMTSTLGLDWRTFRMDFTPAVLKRLDLHNCAV